MAKWSPKPEVSRVPAGGPGPDLTALGAACVGGRTPGPTVVPGFPLEKSYSQVQNQAS